MGVLGGLAVHGQYLSCRLSLCLLISFPLSTTLAGFVLPCRSVQRVLTLSGTVVRARSVVRFVEVALGYVMIPKDFFVLFWKEKRFFGKNAGQWQAWELFRQFSRLATKQRGRVGVVDYSSAINSLWPFKVVRI